MMAACQICSCCEASLEEPASEAANRRCTEGRSMVDQDSTQALDHPLSYLRLQIGGQCARPKCRPHKRKPGSRLLVARPEQSRPLWCLHLRMSQCRGQSDSRATKTGLHSILPEESMVH